LRLTGSNSTAPIRSLNALHWMSGFESPLAPICGSDVHQFVDRIREDLMVPRLRTVTVTDTLPANMVYRTGSSVPPAQVVGKSLVWSRNLPAGGLTMTLQAMPKELGRQPTSVEAHALVEFVGADAVSAEFPIPVVNVLPEARIFLPVARWDRAAP